MIYSRWMRWAAAAGLMVSLHEAQGAGWHKPKAPVCELPSTSITIIPEQKSAPVTPAPVTPAPGAPMPAVTPKSETPAPTVPSPAAPAPGQAPDAIAPDAAAAGAQAAPSDLFSSGLDVAAGNQTIAPNMFGDQFATGSGRSQVTINRILVGTGVFPNASTSGASGTVNAAIYNGDLSSQSIVNQFNTSPTFTNPDTRGNVGGPKISGPIFGVPVSAQADGRPILTTPGGSYRGVPVGESSGVTQLVNSTLGTSSPGAPSSPVNPISPGSSGGSSGSSSSSSDSSSTRSAAIVDANSGVLVIRDPQQPAAPSAIGISGTQGEAFYTYNIVTAVNAPSPANGGVVGRTKLSDDNSPMPRDRFIFQYDFFKNASLTANGVDVNRFSPGVEKTFFDGWTSFEFRVPFASTLDSTVVQGAESTNIEFGNINLTSKALLYRSNEVNISTGLGVALPTADDLVVRLANGTDLVRIQNESVILTPFIAAMFTPNDRFFAQTWMAFSFDSSGSPVAVNTFLTGLQAAGSLDAQTLMTTDIQLGYWLVQNGTGLLQAAAPFIELHYNHAISQADRVTPGGFVVGDLGGNFDELNLSLGVTTLIGDNLNLATGLVVPLRDGDDKTFDYQLGVRANYFYGYTARNRRAATNISTF